MRHQQFCAWKTYVIETIETLAHMHEDLRLAPLIAADVLATYMAALKKQDESKAIAISVLSRGMSSREAFHEEVRRAQTRSHMQKN